MNINDFNHPFLDNNRMKLIDDVELEESVSEDSLASDFDGVTPDDTGIRRTAVDRKVESDNIFEFSKSLTNKKK